jgi:lipopolysaccharide export system ATP-binding protein
MYRRAREGRLGYLPQDRSVFGALTTEENLIAAMEFLGYSRSEQRKALKESLEKFNLKHIRRTKVGMGGSGGLSGGERRRLEIARALLAKPRILLLDEPFANVDPITVEGIQTVIRQLADEGIAVLITDHQVDETLAITDRSYIVNSGKVLCSGTPIEVLSNPAAIQRYFGAKAEFSRKRILEKLGMSEADLPPIPANETIDSVAAPQTALSPTPQEPREPRRAALTLNRRDVGAPRQTPSPRENRAPNRFSDKMGSLFKKKR